MLKHNLKDYALSIVGKFSSRFTNYTFSPENYSDDRNLKLLEIIKQSRKGGSMTKVGFWERLFNDLYMLEQQILNRNNWGTLSMTSQVPTQRFILEMGRYKKDCAKLTIFRV